MSEKAPVGDLTKLMVFFGRVPETHIKALKEYPWIFFNDLSEAKLDYSIETTDKTKVTTFSYDLTVSLENNDHLNKRYKALESAIRALFWKDVLVEIKINGQEVYKSE